MEKLFVVYQPKFQAAKFVIDGIVLENVKPIPLNLQKNSCSYALYGIFLFLHMFRLAYLFRYTRKTRKLLLNASKGKILFWDCCGFKEYRLMDWRFRKAGGKDIFLWNPLSRWDPDENGIKRSIQYLKSRNFRVYSFDALFLRKKLITNCSAIEKMDFYHPSNIYIIRDSNLEGLEEFMRMPYEDIDAEIVNQYEVNHCLRDFLKNAVRE